MISFVTSCLFFFVCPELEFDDSVDLSTPISYDTFPRRASSLGSAMPSSGGFGALGVNRNDSMGSAKDVPLGGSSSSSRLGRIFNHRSGSGRSRFRRSDQDMAGTEHSVSACYLVLSKTLLIVFSFVLGSFSVHIFSRHFSKKETDYSRAF